MDHFCQNTSSAMLQEYGLDAEFTESSDVKVSPAQNCTCAPLKRIRKKSQVLCLCRGACARSLQTATVERALLNHIICWIDGQKFRIPCGLCLGIGILFSKAGFLLVLTVLCLLMWVMLCSLDSVNFLTDWKTSLSHQYTIHIGERHLVTCLSTLHGHSSWSTSSVSMALFLVCLM